jgi:murein DD-endopeptidase MepM/ murein hydrolase activator NlpD
VDLASTQNAVVEASNRGIINFTGDLGIFGNTVIIDHGQGLFSFYAHLNNITASEGQTVDKGTPIGYTGSSGLAGGDHLHYGIFVGHKFVNPQEWWDPHWIKDNVERKLNLSS